MSQQVGTVTAVQSERRGVIATGWTGHDMTVVNAADLDREGGDLSPDDGQTLYAYSGVTDGASELDPDVVMMADTAPDNWPTETVDPETGDVIPAEVRLDVWPERLDVTAMVDLGDWEMLPCVVPHALRPFLVDGVREVGSGETVTATRVSGVWTVSDVLAHRPEIQGTAMYWPSADVLPHVEITGDTIEVHKADDEGDEIVTTSLGGDEGDFLQLSADGVTPSVSLSSDGAGVLDTLDVGTSVSVGGADLLSDIIAPLPKGLVSAYTFTANSATIGNSECGIVDIAFDAEPGRSYRIAFDGWLYASAPCEVQMYLRARSSGDGSTSAAPTIASSALWATGRYEKNTTGGGLMPKIRLERTLVPNTDYANTSQYRVLLSMNVRTSGVSAQIYNASTSQLYVEDVGLYRGDWADAVANNGGGSPASGGGTIQNPPAASVKTYTRTWTSSASRSWRGSSVVTDGVLHHGYYGGYQRYSVILFPADIASTLSGATVKSVKFYIKNLSWYASVGGYARIGHYDSGSLPSSPQTSGGGAFTTAKWAPGAGIWINIPSGWWPGIKSGAIRGITLGESAGTSPNYYGKFATAANMQIVYVK